MENIVTYAENTLEDFTAKPFCAVDSLILSQLAYLRYDGLVGDLSARSEPLKITSLLRAETFGELFRVHSGPDTKPLLFALAASPRFRDITLNYYVNLFDDEAEKQFSALTFFLPDHSVFCAFRGTDGTMVGWKEDFNMAYETPVPAQTEGAHYLDEVAHLTRGPIRVGGHSKGGNIAVYSAAKCSEGAKKRLVGAYSHDGPGFRSEIINSPDFLAVKKLIYKTIPESSVIGMLLQNHESHSVVMSGNFWILQHDPFSWETENGDFKYASDISESAKYMDTTLDSWMDSLSDDRRRLLVDSLFSVLQSTDAQTFSELKKNWQRELPSLLAAYRKLEPATKEILGDVLKALGAAAFRTLGFTEKEEKSFEKALRE